MHGKLIMCWKSQRHYISVSFAKFASLGWPICLFTLFHTLLSHVLCQQIANYPGWAQGWLLLSTNSKTAHSYREECFHVHWMLLYLFCIPVQDWRWYQVPESPALPGCFLNSHKCERWSCPEQKMNKKRRRNEDILLPQTKHIGRCYSLHSSVFQ